MEMAVSQTRSSTMNYYQPHPSQYRPQEDTDCPDCCHANGFTSQCTDECRVVSCDDPTHHDALMHEAAEIECDDEECLRHAQQIEQQCPWGGPAHCPNFDRFIRTEFFPELRSGHSPASRQLTLPYDPNSPFLGPPPVHHRSPTGSETPSSSDGRSNQSVLFSSESGVTSSSSMPPSPLNLPSMADMGLHSLSSPSADKSVKCLWSHCTSSFDSMAELVSHVNMHHLSQGAQSMLPTSMQIKEAENNFNMLGMDTPGMSSCLWKDCNSSASLFPESSAGQQPYIPVEVLMSHLLQDHLGLPPNANYNLHNGDLRNMIRMHAPDITNQPLGITATTSGVGIACHWKGCGLVFANNEQLTDHINEKHVGSGKAHYDCFWEGCNRSGERGFTSKQKVCRHIQSHTGHKPFLCEICKQSFSEAATLQQHMRRHTRERPCVCDFPGCKKAFSTTGALTIHKRVHNGHKPFKCTYCDKGFAESSNLAKHLRTHTGEKPYACPEHNCGKAFARPDQLTRHLAVHAKKRL